jgi:hypothetical protein
LKYYFVLKTDPNEKRDEDTGPKLDDLGFWDKLVALVASVIEEDRNSYAPVLSQFPAELNIGQVKCLILYNSYKIYKYISVCSTKISSEAVRSHDVELFCGRHEVCVRRT